MSTFMTIIELGVDKAIASHSVKNVFNLNSPVTWQEKEG